MTRLWTILTIGILLILAGCPGGSTMPITITAVTPAAGVQGQTVLIQAVITGGSPPYTYGWDFGTWGNPSTSTDAAPLVELVGSTGTQTIGLSVTDGDSNALGFFNFEIQSGDAVTAVSPTGGVGLPLGEAAFEATTTATPDSLAWDFGTGALPQNYGGDDPVVTLQNPGTYIGTVTATFDSVVGTPFPFEYTVEEPVAPEWNIMRLGNASTQAGWINLIVHQDRLTAIYNNAGQLMCSRAKVADPQTDVDWDTHIIGPGYIFGHHAVVSIDGNLAMLYFTDQTPSGSMLRFAVSDVSVPTSSADWTTYELPSGFFTQPGFGAALANVDDHHLIMAFASFSDSSGMRIAVSDDAAPASGSAWSTNYRLNKDTGGFFWPNIAVRETDILLSVQESGPLSSVVRLLVTDNMTPDADGEWDLLDWIPRSQFGHSGGNHELQILDGAPWVVYASATSGNESVVQFFYSSQEVPASKDDWNELLFFRTPGFPPSLVFGVGLPVSAGRPAVAGANYADTTLRLVRCVRVDPQVLESWEATTILNYGPADGNTGICSAAMLDERVAVAVVTADGAKVAFAQGRY